MKQGKRERERERKRERKKKGERRTLLATALFVSRVLAMP